MKTELMKDGEKLRNPLCVRWDDESHRRLTDTAWRRRISTSALVRQLVIDGLGKEQQEVTQ